MGRNRVTQIGILLGSCLLGAAVGYLVAHATQLRSARAHLLSYAVRLRRLGDQIGAENTAAIASILEDGQEFCSDAELIFMRNYIFHAPHIRDMGRTKDGLLYCTSSLGRIDPPSVLSPVDLVSAGVLLRKSVHVTIADGTMGVVVERNGVGVVFNPELLESLEEPPMHYSALYFDQDHTHMLALFGPDGPLSIAEVLSEKPLERNGVLYQSVCSPTKARCALAYESRQDVLFAGRRMTWWALVDGGLIGAILGAIGLSFYRRRRSMESQLRRALRSGTVTLVYQPIVDMATGRIVAAEALARWVDEDGQSIRPDVFVALAELRGFTSEITKMAVGCVTEELSDMLSGSFRVSINISPLDLTAPEFFRHLDQCVSITGIDPLNLVLEVTERSVADQEASATAIAKLRGRGYGVFIDDFGTGYSNLALLHKLEVDGIKIDRAFTQTVGTDAMRSSIVPQILEIARQLDLLVVVEGIETEEQAEYFRNVKRGILGQGWLYGRPVPAAQFRKLLELSDPTSIDAAD